MRYKYSTDTHVIFCAGCMATLILVGAPGMDVEQEIVCKGWDPDGDDVLCPKCQKLAEQQLSFKGVL